MKFIKENDVKRNGDDQQDWACIYYNDTQIDHITKTPN